MGISVADNFDHKSKKPLDARTSYSTLALMKAVTDANINEGCLAYCAETDKYYKFLSTNTVDESTGKWREFSSGGSTGGGHTIEDSEGTDLTQRDTLQFGEGFKAEDDDTNEKTVISPDIMQSGDMDDVITPLPSVRPHTTMDSCTLLGEQIINSGAEGSGFLFSDAITNYSFIFVRLAVVNSSDVVTNYGTSAFIPVAYLNMFADNATASFSYGNDNITGFAALYVSFKKDRIPYWFPKFDAPSGFGSYKFKLMAYGIR